MSAQVKLSILGAIKRLLLAFVVVCAFFVITQDLQVFPSTVPALLRMNPGAPPSGFVEHFIKSSDGTDIRVWEISAQGAERGIVLLLHGNADSLPAQAPFRTRLARHGISSFSFDYRGTGGSQGWPSEDGIYRDGEAVMRTLLAKKGVTSNSVSIMGISVGTGPAAYLAQHFKTGRLILVSPYFSIRDLVKEMPLFGMLTPFLKYDFPTATFVSRAPETKITIFHGEDDTTIPISHSERIAASMAGAVNFELIRVSGAGHNDVLGRVFTTLVERSLLVSEIRQ